MILLLLLALLDSDSDGYPDAAELTSGADREAFRGWFLEFALSQYLNPSKTINDCSALARAAYREALKVHDKAWRKRWHIQAGVPDVKAYNYPDVPLLSTALFRVEGGSYRETDVSQGRFAPFADARHLIHYSATLVGREGELAEPGDLLAWRHGENYHLMIAFEQAGQDYVVYHTGPVEDTPGEMRALPLKVFTTFPDPSWRPVEENPYFLGVYRWKILE